MMCPLTSSAFTISTARPRAPTAAATPKALRQVLWCPYGSIRIRLDNGREKADVLLDSPDKGLIVEHYMWREMIWEKKDSVLCVAADSYYDESDYIRDYDEFLEAVKGKDLD